MGYIDSLEHFTIVREVGLRAYFPDIINAGGRYVLSYRESPERRFTRHLDPSSFPVLLAGADLRAMDVPGRRIVASLRGGGVYPCLTQLASGALVMTDMRWEISPHSGGQIQEFYDLGWPARFAGSYIIPFELHGDSVIPSAPRKISIPEFPEVGVTGSMIHTGGENYLLAADIDDSCYDREAEGQTILLHTPDSGLNWELYSVITREKGRKRLVLLVEPCVRLLSDGRMLCLMRSMDAKNSDFIFRCESNDLGRTWTEPEPLEITGHPPFFMELPDGRLLSLYGKRFGDVRGIAACISRDAGRTWLPRDEVMLRTDGENSDLGYPRAALMPDGSIFAVYYMTHGFDMPDEKRPPHELDCPVCKDSTELHFCHRYAVRSIQASRFFVK